VASQVQISSYQAGNCSDASAERRSIARAAATQRPAVLKSLTPATLVAVAKDTVPYVVAHSFEFVALPGRAAGVQSEIPVAMRHAFTATDGFMGCIVLVSERESRLVTVITLWTGSNRDELRTESSQRLQRWLAPYVDRWLRTRKYASFVAAPGHFLDPDVAVPSAFTHLQ
jgi:hypothetical protein